MTKEIALHRDEGKSIWMLGGLLTFKATGAETDGRFSLIEVQNAPGGGSPPHIHHGEDEFFYILEGEVEVTIGDQKILGKPGSFVFAPRDIPHQFTAVGSQNARLLIGLTPAGLEKFFQEIGEPAPSLTIPPQVAPTMEQMVAVANLAKQYSAEILLPTPAA